jgi:hypothetical protein
MSFKMMYFKSMSFRLTSCKLTSCKFRPALAVCGALLIVVSGLPGAAAQSRTDEAVISVTSKDRLAFLSGKRTGNDPPEEAPAPRINPPQDNTGFDGAWTFTSAGCRHTGSLPAIITGGRIIIRGGSGQVDPDGTLHSVGAGGGMTLTAEGQLSGNTGSGTFNRSDGCIGTWIAIKRRK